MSAPIVDPDEGLGSPIDESTTTTVADAKRLERQHRAQPDGARAEHDHLVAGFGLGSGFAPWRWTAIGC